MQQASVHGHGVDEQVGNDLVDDVVDIVLHDVVLRGRAVQSGAAKNYLAKAVDSCDGGVVEV